MALPPIKLPGMSPAAGDDKGGDKDDGMASLIADIDKLVPGLGDLMAEFADRIKSEDETQDEEMEG